MLVLTFGILVVIVIVTNLLIVMATDYCNPSLCYGYGKHIGCENDRDFSPKCPDNRFIVNMTHNMKYFILNKHNQLRSFVAMGQIDGYESADRMAQMILKAKLIPMKKNYISKSILLKTWDSELASLAEMNVKTCKFGHDKCFKTDNFPLAGQNLYEIRSTSKFKWDSFTEAIDYFIDRWFNEHTNADMNVIGRYRSNGRKIGHFTQIVSSESSKVGCAMIMYKRNRYVTLYFVCNYSLSNILNAPIYTSGKPCSRCSYGCSKLYPGLCKVN
ncbi:Antigen 5 like allergen Cul n 1 [Pseudolycoriella hygida]|uniref:Antigen 5 like allergen Cul n 1 n=1 Tax=Pseudolycoriella hygida TaxID=35572 RepID=A0A9Q0MU22_9DIPT|nr:Antigen 5 like allergen Cul n 1 [Pseudolycoriella hygida]